uniref:phosphatidylinositol 4-phosphate 5-kinase-like protein 1 isoform X1 n=2 Tax=Myodes glareolus TaxID=447135 RepID=UPI0020216FEE|nr:phosphatidylinositol 4-phosphate 5-kinase-like protein 1 isoform X1 [Myodes glareolus]
MPKNSRRTQFRLPASRASTRNPRPRFRRKLRRKSFRRHPKESPAAPPDQAQGEKDAAAAAEVGVAGKGQRPPRGLDITRAEASRLACRNVEVGPDSSIAVSGIQPKPEKLQLGAMATPSPGPRERHHRVLFVSCDSSHQSSSLEVANKPVPPGSQHGFLWRLRDKHNRVGLFEVNPGHELHRMTRMMQEGLWAATQVFMDNPPKGPPSQKDFSEVMTQVHEEGFEMGTLAGPAFARLRQFLGLSEEDYQATLGPGGPYLQFLSTSKSKASFFLSHDQRFFLKTQRHQEVQVLLAHLPRYVQHLRRHPHSLLARLLGVHSLRIARGKKKYFIIMMSIFYPVSRISERYDIKACEVSRWVEPVPEGSPFIVVLKDLNFEGKTINLGSQRSWFLRQMELDTAFLRDLHVLDYSLLVAFQLLHEDEKDSYNVYSTMRSVHDAPNLGLEEGRNRRLLLDVPNALHVLDGPDQRYFLGLVDLTTVYGLRKRLEQLWKTMRYPGQSFSTVSPARYARRLCQWVETHTV